MNYKPCSTSNLTITELMVPAYTNFGGKVHGGTILSLIDKVAYAVAIKHSENYCVTLSLYKVLFLKSIEVGELVHLKGSVNYVGHTSMVVGVKVMAENIKTGEIRHTNSSYLTMVALNEEDVPIPVPGLSIHSQKEMDRWVKACLAKKQKPADRQKARPDSVKLRDLMKDEQVIKMF